MKGRYSERLASYRSSPWKGKGPLLGHLTVELTERCNNRCIHCYINRPVDDALAENQELSTTDWREILKEAAGLGCLEVRFTGGEPLLREDFSDLYVFTRKLGIKVALSTNATLITPRLARLFRRIPPLEKIDITLYGVKRKSYEAVSQNPGSFAAAMAGIGLLARNQVPFSVKGILLPPTEGEVAEFEAWAAALPGMDEPPPRVLFFDLHAWRKKERSEAIRRLRVSPQKGLELLMRRRDAYIEDRQLFCSRFMAAPGKRLFSCGAGIGSGCVNAYGGFQPCVLLRHPDAVFDLKTGNLEKALRGFFPSIRKRKAANPEYLKRCARCFLKGLCDQCPAKSWMEHGTLDKPVEYLCEIAQLEARVLGLLKKDERPWEVRDAETRKAALLRRPGLP